VVERHRLKGRATAGFAVIPRPCLYKRNDFLIHLVPAVSHLVPPCGAGRAVTDLNIVQAVVDLSHWAFRLVFELVITPCGRQELSDTERTGGFVQGFSVPVRLLCPQFIEAHELTHAWHFHVSVKFWVHEKREAFTRSVCRLRYNRLKRSHQDGY